ncbi:MAG: DUF1499 domain-containing protein [Sphingomonadales bacterium]|nr:DUF1499 domain-containing protein [Sphingomonadales bacterium]
MVSQAGWGARLARWARVLAGIALLVGAGGLILARYDIVDKIVGFSAFLGGGGIALLALVSGLAGLIASRRSASPGRRGGVVAILFSAGYVAFLVSRPLVAGEVPAIHDITTDLADPPRFEVLQLRKDNLAGVETVENWRRIHAQAYGDLRPITIPRPVAEVTADAVRLARAEGWRIAASDPSRGHVEATASVSFIRFQDDVVIRIAPTADGNGSQVDMRSVSRVGRSDFGVNAKRIRAFLKRLAEG